MSRVAQVEWIEDIQAPQGSPESEDIILMIFFAVCMLLALNIGGTNIEVFTTVIAVIQASFLSNVSWL